jgi:hypothetical protein
VTIGGTAHGAKATTESGCLGAAHTAAHGATQNLRGRGQCHEQRSAERGAREKGIRFHGRLLSRPRPFRNLSKEYYESAALNLPLRGDFLFLT